MGGPMLRVWNAKETVKPETEAKLAEIRSRVLPELQKDFALKEVKLGSALYLRIFKESKELECWVQSADQKAWKLWKTFPILTYGSGTLGPKLKEGDGQAPEGFYSVAASQLNPASSYHLSFNIGYPNAYDKSLGRTGSFIMVHGKKASIGCFAIGDPAIEELYLAAEAALAGGQTSFAVHAFPFRMTPDRLAKAKADHSPHYDFWSKELLPTYDKFERAVEGSNQKEG
jgi:murein L,D-transpeptidase YafK